MASGSKYRLQALFKLREKGVEEARRRLAAAVEEVAERAKDIEKVRSDLEKAKETLRQRALLPSKTSLRGQDLFFRESLLQSLKKKVNDFEERLRLAIEAFEKAKIKESEATKGVKIARRELEVLAKHKEKWEKQKVIEAQKKEQEITEEAGLSASWRKGFESLD